MRLLIILSAVTLALSACMDGAPSPPPNQPEHPLLDDLAPPPLNSPLRQAQIKHDAAQPQLAAGDQPALMVVQDGAAFSGQLIAPGTFAVTADQIEFQPDDAAPLTVMYRLPDAMGNIAETRGTGRLQLLDRSGPAGANRIVVLTREDTVVFGEIWQRSAGPLNVSLSDRLRLVQTETRVAERTGDYTPVDLALYDGEELIADLPIGESSEISTPGGDLSFFLETSQLFESAQDMADQYAREYILHVWVSTTENQQ